MAVKKQKFSDESLQVIVGWTIQEIAQMVRHPTMYSEPKYTKMILKQLCRELGIDYDGIVISFTDTVVDGEIEDGREYKYVD